MDYGNPKHIIIILLSSTGGGSGGNDDMRAALAWQQCPQQGVQRKPGDHNCKIVERSNDSALYVIKEVFIRQCLTLLVGDGMVIIFILLS